MSLFITLTHVTVTHAYTSINNTKILKAPGGLGFGWPWQPWCAGQNVHAQDASRANSSSKAALALPSTVRADLNTIKLN
jgi:hypothetical protein